MRRIIAVTASLAVLLGLAAFAGPASAAGLGGASSFSASNAGLGDHQFIAGGRFDCTTVAGAGAVNPSPVDASGDPTTATIDPAFTGCTWYLAGIRLPATVTDTCAWTLAITGFTSGTGASTGTFGPSCSVAIKPNQVDCTFTVQPFSATVAGQNLPVPPAAPTSLRTSATATGLSYTTSGSNCLGIPSGTNGSYSGSLASGGVFAVS